jgi:chromosome segregation ATPase
MFRSFLDTFGSLRAEMARLEIENKRLVEHNTVIEKELETLNEENAKLSGANDDAMKKLAEVEEEKAGLQKELGGLEGLKEVLGWKKRCEELENRATENQERMEKLFEDYQQKTEKRIAEVQQGQQNLEQEIDRIKADHTLEMQSLTSAMGFMVLKDGYIFTEKVGLDDCVDRINMCQ